VANAWRIGSKARTRAASDGMEADQLQRTMINGENLAALPSVTASVAVGATPRMSSSPWLAKTSRHRDGVAADGGWSAPLWTPGWAGVCVLLKYTLT
jgi:hypothetical protein